MLWKLMQRQQQIMDSRNRRTPALTAQYCKDFQYWTTWSSLLLINIFNVCDRVWHTGLFYKLKSYGISSRIFSLILSFLSNRQLRVVLDGKSSQEYPFNSGVTQCLILCFTLFLLYIKKTKKLHGPFLWMGINCLKARATSRRQFTFYHLSPQKCLVLTLSTSEGWKAELTLEPLSGLEHGTHGLRIQHLNH